jgi:hypothetical protein
VRAIDQFGSTGAWSASNTILPSHPPAVSGQNPTGAVTLLYAATVPFSWVFSDAWSLDSQRAYQILVERNDTNALVTDTGKVLSGVQTVNVAIPVGQKDQPLRWRIQVWDQDDISSGYSNLHPFFASDAPVITITSPTAAQQIGTGRPIIQWTLDAQTVQASYQVKFFRTSDNLLIHDSGIVANNSLSYQPPTTVLVNLENYRVEVTIVDTVGLSSTATRLFSTSYQAPAQVAYTVDASTYGINGYVTIDWSQMQPDTYWLEWRLYRREVTSPTWELLKIFPSVNTRQYQDWEALSGHTYNYAVTQVADRSGVSFESSQSVTPAAVEVLSEYYWLLNPTDKTKNFLLSNVTSDEYSDSIESETYVVIGRGRRTDYGTDLGISGTLTAQLRDRFGKTAREQKQALHDMQRARETYLLRTPFGDVYQVSLGDVSVSRVAGVGRSEFVDVTVPYTEVF